MIGYRKRDDIPSIFKAIYILKIPSRDSSISLTRKIQLLRDVAQSPSQGKFHPFGRMCFYIVFQTIVTTLQA